MKADLGDLAAFVAVARAGGFREAARAAGSSASRLSDAVRRLETRLGVRLLNRTTRSVVPTDAGKSLYERLAPMLDEVDSALDVINGFRDTPSGTLRLNVPMSAARLVLPRIVPRFLAQYPEIRLEVIADESFVDVLAAGCDAGIRYEERLELDMVAVPIGPRTQRMAAGAAPGYLERHGRPRHPRELLGHACMRARFASGAMIPWVFERDGETVSLDPQGPLLVQVGGALDLATDAAVAGTGLVYLFEDWLRPYFERGELEPVLEPWWPRFSGPYLYYPGRRLLPAPLRAFVDFIRHDGG
ncbi:DNA-binding transcriptional LysR family regulator [Pseudoduganella flava]|uniref:DNA-binding transcriptional LysR family regulator n=1 Tax=Pseudoduganella flava TaxID=871742 RepID=A0A562PIJ5_9BURK|nr:LysR family transcriptional regulator [Pseudoduganella flava]QGZ41867.1 LysR family transcriptional regulator [Pseudoduganella flava]TWI44271.1 DNA-binding transcriptional LysR family regulator [Pseudoduganella flava]